MTISGAEDDPLASISGADVGLDDKSFSDNGGNETDCTSICDEGKDGLPDVLEGDCSWLLRDLGDALKDMVTDSTIRTSIRQSTTLKREPTSTHPVFDSNSTIQGPRRNSTGSKSIGSSKYCKFVGQDLVQAYEDLTIQSLKDSLS
ncbi:hypothetical protein D8B26_003467 [Coccidioides posadasii str. Silveira]|uniref:Uncharacterized protein n=1 Tax=Coccidioides posadasii (strain RMSCC 757 / Silveira) TaxID=443226 RepID=E9D176_COCPS|nr:conserved hypothetical protein [Coccidioides posadasii str. Silveira]QVM08791.1 hypothetical protein D8B26_003467 [Coccidioides posadasii str. Silveira]